MVFEESRPVPEFAVLGHPNEGKSSVVSTLTEDDQIRVSPIPGETTVARTYIVTIDGQKIIRFVDTPGFQTPKQTLAWFNAYTGDQSEIISRFIEAHKKDSFFSDECELLTPVAKGAGIIYVVDGSRPVRDDDIAEMEILRLTGRPRMAVINSKNSQIDYTSLWKQEFGKYFNAIRVFNSNTANFTERIRMLESLKAIDQDWEPMLENVIFAFKQEWEKRIKLTAASIMHLLENSLSYSLSEKIDDDTDKAAVQKKLNEKYKHHIMSMEKKLFKHIKTTFKHNIYDYQLPSDSVLKYDLFSSQTWELLGLTKNQLAAVGAVLGGSMGAVIDTAAAGITFGVFTAIGGVLGVGSALLGGKKIVKNKNSWFKLGSDMIQLGPNKNIQFLYVLLDRALIYYSHIINRPHGKRVIENSNALEGKNEKQGFSVAFSSSQQAVCSRFFKGVSKNALLKDKNMQSEFLNFIEEILIKISNS